MSTKQQVVFLEKRLNEADGVFEKGLDILREVLSSMYQLVSDDFDKAENTSGAVSARIEERAEQLELARGALEEAISDIETATGEALYSTENIT